MNADGFARALAKVGTTIKVRRLTSTARIPFEVACRAQVNVGAASVLVAGMQQTADQISITDREMRSAKWPAPPRHGDEIEYADERTGSVQGAPEIHYLGSDRIFVMKVLTV